jgi:hypothetical protein
MSTQEPPGDEIAAAPLDHGRDDADKLHYRSPVMK